MSGKASKNSLKSSKTSLLLGLGGIFILLAFYASGGLLHPFEETIFNTVFETSEKLLPFALVITQAGSVWFALAVVGVLLVVKWRPEPAIAVLRAGVVALVLAEVAKRLVGRPRPVGLLEDVTVREVIVRGYGFPSGHVAIATAVSLTVARYLPRKWQWLPVPWIALVAWSRMYLGVHAPMDILGGLVLGMFAAILATYIPMPIPKNSRLRSKK